MGTTWPIVCALHEHAPQESASWERTRDLNVQCGTWKAGRLRCRERSPRRTSHPAAGQGQAESWLGVLIAVCGLCRLIFVDQAMSHTEDDGRWLPPTVRLYRNFHESSRAARHRTCTGAEMIIVRELARKRVQAVHMKVHRGMQLAARDVRV